MWHTLLLVCKVVVLIIVDVSERIELLLLGRRLLLALSRARNILHLTRLLNCVVAEIELELCIRLLLLRIVDKGIRLALLDVLRGCLLLVLLSAKWLAWYIEVKLLGAIALV